MTRPAVWLSALAIACRGGQAAPEGETCDMRPSEFCARADGGCPSAATEEAFCAWLAARGLSDVEFSVTRCDELKVIGYSSSATVHDAYLFDDDGELALVIDFTGGGGKRCVAGPPSLPPALLCTTKLTPKTCAAILDAGAD